jgi:hypothetical protein
MTEPWGSIISMYESREHAVCSLFIDLVIDLVINLADVLLPVCHIE